MPYSLLIGDCRQRLADVPTGSVQTCITSPPYFGLRDYGMADQIGLEQTPAQFIDELVSVFREVRRTLKYDGTLWVNMGDSYGPNKQLRGTPWRLALALQEDGWHLRQDIIWHKPNPMPESVTDRCTKAHEYIFLLSKGHRYYFNNEAIQEPSTARAPGNQSHKDTAAYEVEANELHRTKSGLVAYSDRQRSKRDSFKRDDSKRAQVIPGQTVGTHRPGREESTYDTDTRNKRSVWTVATAPYAEAHFATYPPALVLPCVLAGSRPGDTVLDPFNGAGTTGLVALENGRQYVGIELNPEYAALTRKRLARVQVDMFRAQPVASAPMLAFAP